MQAGFDQKETEREAKLKETLANLQRIFPGAHTSMLHPAVLIYRSGVRGRLVDLCKPTQRKYESAISVILGRNIDAVVVDEERTAIDCIEVRLSSTPLFTSAECVPISTCATNVQAKRRSFRSTRSK
jgi:structural maintenance of chromosome 1